MVVRKEESAASKHRKGTANKWEETVKKKQNVTRKS